jgi:hypothetical protein
LGRMNTIFFMFTNVSPRRACGEGESKEEGEETVKKVHATFKFEVQHEVKDLGRPREERAS